MSSGQETYHVILQLQMRNYEDEMNGSKLSTCKQWQRYCNAVKYYVKLKLLYFSKIKTNTGNYFCK